MGEFFRIGELCSSKVAVKNNIYNRPSQQVEENLNYLIDNLLDPIRKDYGKRIYVNSGYRSEELNTVIGGAPNSQHLTGEAADITTGTVFHNRKLYDMILANGYEFDQLINEYDFSWLHISLKRSNNRKQILKYGSRG